MSSLQELFNVAISSFASHDFHHTEDIVNTTTLLTLSNEQYPNYTVRVRCMLIGSVGIFLGEGRYTNVSNSPNPAMSTRLSIPLNLSTRRLIQRVTVQFVERLIPERPGNFLSHRMWFSNIINQIPGVRHRLSLYLRTKEMVSLFEACSSMNAIIAWTEDCYLWTQLYKRDYANLIGKVIFDNNSNKRVIRDVVRSDPVYLQYKQVYKDVSQIRLRESLFPTRDIGDANYLLLRDEEMQAAAREHRAATARNFEVSLPQLPYDIQNLPGSDITNQWRMRRRSQYRRNLL